MQAIQSPRPANRSPVASNRSPHQPTNPPVETSFDFKLDRPLAFFDLETTGLNPAQDRIVEMAVLLVRPDGEQVSRVRRFNPEMPIPDEASRIHGIRDEDVAGEAPFQRRAKALATLLEPCDLAGFNIRSFDLPFLLNEFDRARVRFHMEDRRVIDVQQIFHHEEPRNLAAAARFYLDREHDDAHSAEGDTRITAAVLAAQLARYSRLPGDMGELHAYCDRIRPFATPIERWFREAQGGLVFQRGKHKDQRLDAVAAAHPDYLEWMLDKIEDLPLAVVTAVNEALAATGGREP